MKKIISILLCLVMMLGLTACTQFPEVEGDYIVLEVQKQNHSELSSLDDNWMHSTYSLNANGELVCRDVYSLSGEIIKTTTITRDTVLMLVGIVEEEKHARDNLKMEDGVMYEIKYFDKDKNILVDYKGVLTPNYEDVINTLRKSILKAEESFSKQGVLMEFKSFNNNDVWELSQSGKLVYKNGETITKELKLNEDQLAKIQKMLYLQNDTVSRGEVQHDTAWRVGFYDATGKCLKYFSGNIEKYPNLLEVYDLLISVTEID
jgi:cytochrome c-type biogenesis protein CcmE